MRSDWARPQWGLTTAVLGGAFDPPHLGHRQAVQELFTNPGVKEVFITPAAHPPFKRPGCSVQDRLEMVKLNFASTQTDPYPSEVRIDTREIKREQLSPGTPSYTYESLLEYRQLFPRLAFVIGADQLPQMDRWHRFPEILGLCHWIVLERQPDGGQVAGFATKNWVSAGILQAVGDSQWQIMNGPTCLQVVSTQAPNLASTEIRETLAKSAELPEQMLLPSVAQYLKQHRLYGMR